MTVFSTPTAKELGDLIRGLRKQRGWTQSQLAEQADLLPKTISAIESGTGRVLLINVMHCLSALDVDVRIESRHDAEGDQSGLRQRQAASREVGPSQTEMEQTNAKASREDW
ncbi:MAG: helix-turn-helix domain-containing protein [Burkholderiaceae bacterium]